MPEETPPVETPPVVTPPVETPPVETPPVETPPTDVLAPDETPPVETTTQPTAAELQERLTASETENTRLRSAPPAAPAAPAERTGDRVTMSQEFLSKDTPENRAAMSLLTSFSTTLRARPPRQSGRRRQSRA